ncbi:TPA: hypothetical protein ACXNRK_004401 [Pseudomonas aeruginosa]
MQQKNQIAPSLNALTVNRGIFSDLFEEESLLCVREGRSLDEALRVAQTLSSGVHQISLRLSSAINNGDPVYINEVEAIALLSCISSSLISSSRRGIEISGEEAANTSRNDGGAQ